MRATDWFRSCTFSLGITLASCTAPTLSVEAQPDGTRIYIDGEQRGTDSVTVPQPYYGVVRVEAVPAPAEFPAPFRRSTEQMVALDPPITGWLFPFDLAFEILNYPWREPDTKVVIETELRQVPDQTERPPTDELRARALQSLTDR